MQVDPNADDGALFETAMAAVKAEQAKRLEAPPETEEAPVQDGASAAPEPAPTGGPAVAAPSNPQPDAAQAQTAPAPGDQGKPSPEGGAVDPAIKRLLDREAQLQEREKALAQFEAARRKFKYDPVSAIRAIAPDVPLSEIAKTLWVEELGDLAPPEAKQQREVRGVRSEVEELRAQVEEERRRLAEEYAAQQQELAMQKYLGKVQESISSVDAKKYPLVAGFRSKHSDGVVDEMLSIARMHAQSAGEVLPPEQLVERLEAQLARYQVGPAPAPVVTQEVTPPAATTHTLRNQHTQVQPNLTPVNELDDEFLFNKAMKAIQENRKRQG